MLQAKQAGVSRAQRFDIELFLRHDRLSTQHLIGLVQTEDRHIDLFDGWEQQTGDKRHLDRYGVAVYTVKTSNGIEQVILGNAKQIGIVRSGIALGAREDTDGRLASRGADRFTEAARTLKNSRHFLRHEGALSANTANLAATNQLVNGASDGQARRAKLLSELVLGRNHRARGIYAALDTLLDTAAYAHIDRGGLYCFSHCSPATLFMPFFSPLSAKRNFVGRITDLQCSTKRMSLSNSIVLS